MSKFPKLFIPGPTHVSDDILKVLSTPQIGHRTPEISELMNQLPELKNKVLGCWCYPEKCHGDILFKLLKEL